VSELVMVEQRTNGHDAGSVWIREGDERLEGHDCDARLMALRVGLRRHFGVRAVDATTGDEELDRALTALHGPRHLEALASAGEDAAVMPELAPPGLEPDHPVQRGAGRRRPRGGPHRDLGPRPAVLDGDQYAYARLPAARPPRRTRLHRRLLLPEQRPSPRCRRCATGASPRSASSTSTSTTRTGPRELSSGWAATPPLHSLHAAPVTNVAAGTALPRGAARTRPCLRRRPRSGSPIWPRSRHSLTELAADSAALVVSLGYDTVDGDPHGKLALRSRGLCRDRPPARRHRPAGLRGAGGRLLARGAGPVQPRFRCRTAREDPV